MDIELRNEICTELSNIQASAPALMQQTQTDKLYEIFVLSCLARALRNIGAELHARDKSDNPTTELTFRMGPGSIYAPSSSPGFIHVVYNQTEEEYEIQNGIQVHGSSGVEHELDVCLIDRKKAVSCREKRNDPSCRDIKFLAECKYYGSALSLSIGREMIGLAKEFGGKKIRILVANIGKTEIHNLVTKHDITFSPEITPLNSDKVDRFIHWLETELEQMRTLPASR